VASFLIDAPSANITFSDGASACLEELNPPSDVLGDEPLGADRYGLGKSPVHSADRPLACSTAIDAQWVPLRSKAF
jgi:hypothetical protein